MAIHDIEAPRVVVEAIINEERPFHVVNNLDLYIQRGDRIRIKGGGRQALCQVVATTNEHQNINYLVIGLRVVNESESATISNSMVSGLTVAENTLKPWEKDGFSNKEDWDRVKEITKAITKELPLKEKRLASKRRIEELEAEKAEIIAKQKGKA